MKVKPKSVAIPETATVVRSITLPVLAPLNVTWDQLKPALSPMWQLSTDLANWCVAELYVREPRPFPREGPMPAVPAFGPGGLYGLANRAYPDAAKWEGCKQSFGCVIRMAERKYANDRHAVLRRSDHSLLRFRFPAPYPVHNRAWKAHYESGFPVVEFPIPGLGRVALRLKRAPEFGRQLARFRDLESGKAKHGEAALYRNSKGDLLLKLVGHFPKREVTDERPFACLVRTDPAAFLVAEIVSEGHRREWILNCSHLRHWAAAHRSECRGRGCACNYSPEELREAAARHTAYRQRVSEDTKREKRMSRSQRRNLGLARGTRCQKHQHRVSTFLHQITSQLVRLCERQRVGCVVFDDSIRSYLPDGFPWHMLRERLEYKCGEIGVHLVAHNSPDPEEYSAWLADRSLTRAMALAGQRLLAGASRKGSHPRVTTPSKRPASRASKSKPANTSKRT